MSLEQRPGMSWYRIETQDCDAQFIRSPNDLWIVVGNR